MADPQTISIRFAVITSEDLSQSKNFLILRHLGQLECKPKCQINKKPTAMSKLTRYE